MTSEVGNVPEFVVRGLVLKNNFMRQRVDDRDDHRLRIQQQLRVVLRSF
jgi:hypothetical protein